MRTLAIMTRVLKELVRDKRTLALMFLAPIFILILLNFVFSASQSTNVTVGTVTVSQSLDQELAQTKHVAVKSYSDLAAAKQALKADRVDAIVHQKQHDYSLT
ncbi:ABC transporter permease, partial [Loigolactobacillus coryniformis]